MTLHILYPKQKENISALKFEGDVTELLSFLTKHNIAYTEILLDFEANQVKITMMNGRELHLTNIICGDLCINSWLVWNGSKLEVRSDKYVVEHYYG